MKFTATDSMDTYIKSSSPLSQRQQSKLNIPPFTDGKENTAQPEEGDLEAVIDQAQELLGKQMAAAAADMEDAFSQLLDQRPVQEAAQKKSGNQRTDAERKTPGETAPDDTAFDKSMVYGKSGKAELLRQLELEQLFKELLQALETWQPHPGHSLSQEILQLGDLFQRLMQNIATLSTLEDHALLQADRLNELLLLLADRLGSSSFPNLIYLLEQYGDKGTADLLWASVLSWITGKTASPGDTAATREAMAAREAAAVPDSAAGRAASSGNTATDTASARALSPADDGGDSREAVLHSEARDHSLPSGPRQGQDHGRFSGHQTADHDYNGKTGSSGRYQTSGGASGRAFQENGVLYSRLKGNQIKPDQRYHNSIRELERSYYLKAETIQKGQETCQNGSHGKQYSVSDVERTEQFLSHVMNRGNLCCNPVLNARNEELLGFLMAASMTKVRIYSQQGGAGKKLTAGVQTALERFFRYYLARALERSFLNSKEAAQQRRPDRKLIQKIYYQIMRLILQEKTLGQGLEKGLEYAYQLFLRRTEKKGTFQTSSKSAFFSDSGSKHETLGDLKRGAAALDDDWKEFLDSVGQNHNRFLQAVFSHSPWGILIDDMKAPDVRRAPPRALAAVAMLVLAGLVLAVTAGLLFTGGI